MCIYKCSANIIMLKVSFIKIIMMTYFKCHLRFNYKHLLSTDIQFTFTNAINLFVLMGN